MIVPPNASDGLKPIPRLFYLFFFFSDPTCSCWCYCEFKSPTHIFFNFAPCSGEYYLLFGSCNRRFVGGAIVETLVSLVL